MAIKPTQQLQKASLTLQSASDALGAAAALYGAAVAQAMAEAPFASETDVLVDAWKATARMAKEAELLASRAQDTLATLERHNNTSPLIALPMLPVPQVHPLAKQPPVKKIAATKVKKPSVTLSAAPKKKVIVAASKPKAEKQPVPVASKKVKAAAKLEPVAAKLTKPAAKKSKAAKSPATMPASGTNAQAKPNMTGNATKVLAALQTLLAKKDGPMPTQVQVAEAAGIPMGSITASLSVLKALGRVAEPEKGVFMLPPVSSEKVA